MKPYKSVILRSETKLGERRTALTPYAAERIIKETGLTIKIEQCPQRIYPIELYEEVGCITVPRFSWFDSPKTELILGLKELPDFKDEDYLLNNDHIYFAHVYKNQEGAEDWLKKFKDDNGRILDLEFLKDKSGKRVAAFGHWAGYMGAAVALDLWLRQKNNESLDNIKLEPYFNKNYLLNTLKSKLHDLKPKLLIIGSKGRCGTGAQHLLNDLNINNYDLWGKENTQAGGPFKEILEYDILLNCVYLTGPMKPFINAELLATHPQRKLTTISDISCDPNGPYNPLPIYNDITTMDNAFRKIDCEGSPLYITAIDHLPSLLPRESSEDFCMQLLPYLINLLNGKVEKSPWERTLNKFEEHISEV